MCGCRYAQDVGVVLEQCSPYEGKDDVCRTKTQCARHYTAYYRYVGGGHLKEEMASYNYIIGFTIYVHQLFLK